MMLDSRPLSYEEFAQVVARLNGQVAWRSRAGSGTGSIFTLQFGAPMPGNDKLGEYCLMVYCAWRIVEADRILCSWHEDSGVALAPALQQLEGTNVVRSTLSP